MPFLLRCFVLNEFRLQSFRLLTFLRVAKECLSFRKADLFIECCVPLRYGISPVARILQLSLTLGLLELTDGRQSIGIQTCSIRRAGLAQST